MKIEEEIKDSNFEKDCLFCVYDTDPKRKVEPYEYPCSECNGYNKFERYNPDQEESNEIYNIKIDVIKNILQIIQSEKIELLRKYPEAYYPIVTDAITSFTRNIERKIQRKYDEGDKS